MDDLTLTKKCAEAMGLRIDTRWPKNPVCILPNKTNYRGRYRYDPLRDDAQAMALAKKFKLNIAQLRNGCKVFTSRATFTNGGFYESDATDLNRAICKCVANMVPK